MTDVDSHTPATTGSPQRTRHRVVPRMLIVLGVCLVLVVTAVVIYAATLERSVTRNISRGIDLPAPNEPERPTKEPLETGTLNYVLLGSDSRDPNDVGSGRSDSIMVVHLDSDRSKASIISFPRDMYVEVPDHGKNKINAAFALGGAPLVVRTLEDLTHARMDHVVLVDFEGFTQLTDDLDGVTVTNKTAFSSHGFDFPKGKITIKGAKALWFVRERHSLPRGDLDRAENQRNVIKAIVRKGLSAGVVADPAAFTSFLGNVATHLTVDNSLTDDEIRRTALSLRLTGSDIELLQAPLSGFGTTSGGESIDLVDEAKLAELSKALKDDAVGDYLKKYPQG